MKIFTRGIDSITISYLKTAGFTVISQSNLPEKDQVQGDMFFTTSEFFQYQELDYLRETYPKATLIYFYQQKGVKNYQSIYLKCVGLNIHFIPPRSTATMIVDKFNLIAESGEQKSENLIAFLGSGTGIGCTSVAKAFAKHIAATGKKVILLGLDLYDPGYNFKPEVTLDTMRPKMTGRIINADDFNNLPQTDGYRYLPGNFDYLSAQDYQEDEIEYLLIKAQENADVVIADIGSIPESAAWYVAMQKAAIHILVTHPRHYYRLEQLIELGSHMDFQPHDFQVIINRSNSESPMTSKNLSTRLGLDVLMEIPVYGTGAILEELPLERKDIRTIDERIKQILVTMNLLIIDKKKGIFS